MEFLAESGRIPEQHNTGNLHPITGPAHKKKNEPGEVSFYPLLAKN